MTRLFACRLVAVAALTMAAGCEGAGARTHGGPGGGGREGKGHPPAQPLPVAVTAVETTRIERFYATSGTLQALRSAELVAVVPAIIVSLSAEEGDLVTDGQLLAKLDGRSASLGAKQAALSLKNLEKELRRLESARGGVVPKEEIDKQRYLVEEARGAAKISRHTAAQMTVRAPFTGTITARHVDIGNMATASAPLFSLADLSGLELELHLPEREAAQVSVGSSVEIELIDGSTFEAKVARRAPIVDALTGTVKFTVRSTTHPKAAVPGAFARARVLVAAKDDVPSLPKSAVVEIEGEPHVHVLREGKARRVPVQLGLAGSERIEIVAGVDANATIVVDAGAGITEGMPLRPAEDPTTAQADPPARPGT